MDRFATDLQDFLREAKVASKTIIKMISRVRSRAQTCNDNVCLHLMQLETTVEELSHCSPPAGTTSGVLGSHGPIGADTTLGMAMLRGTKTTLTASVLFSLVLELQKKIDLLSEQAKNTGVVFNNVTFASETKFSVRLGTHNPAGMGFAAMVDLQLIWIFDKADIQDSSTWIIDMQKSKQIGFKRGKLDVLYMHSMGQKYPTSFIGKEKNIASTTTIKMLESFEILQGNGMGNGKKARLT